MSPSPSRLLVAFVNILLALPPGWCCAALPGGGEAPAPARRSGCHGQSKAPAGRPPAHPGHQTPDRDRGCACPDRDSATARRSKCFPVQLIVALDVLPAPGVPPSHESHRRVVPVSAFYFPSPQLLHCVWLC
jgi:hypothetical protein